MKDDKFLNMSPRERDAFVAEKVFGWRKSVIKDWDWLMEPPESEPQTSVREIPRYTTSFDGAELIVEKLKADGWYYGTMNTVWDKPVVVFVKDGEVFGAIAGTLPVAVSIAALKVVGAIK